MNYVGERPKEAGNCRRMTGMVRKEGKNCRAVICSILLSLVFMLFMAGNTAHSEILLPESSWDYLTEDQIPTDNYELMGFMMREILAMHGYQFEPGSNYDVYFRDTFWYYPYALNNLEAYANLSDAEWHNLELFRQLRAIRGTESRSNDLMTSDPLFYGSKTPLLSAKDPEEVFSGPTFSIAPETIIQSAPGGDSSVIPTDHIDTGRPAAIAGYVNNYCFVRYVTTDGKHHTGYIGEYYLPPDLTDDPELSFIYSQGTISEECALFDDPVDGTVLAVLPSGTTVTILFRCGGTAGQELCTYIETRINDERVRGFVNVHIAEQIITDEDILSRENAMAAIAAAGEEEPGEIPAPETPVSIAAEESNVPESTGQPGNIDVYAAYKPAVDALTGFLRENRFDDSDSEEAYEAVEAFLRSCPLVSGVVRDGSTIYFKTADGLCMGYTGKAIEEGTLGFSDPDDTFEDYLDGKPVDSISLESGIPITNNHFMILAPGYTDRTISSGFNYMYEKLNDTAHRLGYPQIASIEESISLNAWRKIRSGEIADTGLLILTGHGLTPATEQDKSGKYILGDYVWFFAIDHGDTQDDLALLKEVDTYSLTLTDKNGKPTDAYLYLTSSDKQENSGEYVFYCSLMVSSNYLDRILGDITFDNTVVILDSCYALRDSRAASMFFNRGASLVVGSSEKVGSGAMMAIVRHLLERIEEENTEIYFEVRSNEYPEYLDEYIADFFMYGVRNTDDPEEQVRFAGINEEDVLHSMKRDGDTNYPEEERGYLLQFMAEVYDNFTHTTDGNVFDMIPRKPESEHRVFTGEAPLSGKVYSVAGKDDRQPLEGAEVRLYRWMNHAFEEGPTVYTDEFGEYQIEDLPYGIWGIEARYGDDFSVHTTVEHKRPEEKETKVKDLELSLYLEGTVVTQMDCRDNAPAYGAYVQAVCNGKQYAGTTDVSGRYRIPVHPGEYAIMAEYADASGYAVNDSCTAKLDASSHTAPTMTCGYTISGYVYDAVTGKPLSGVTVGTSKKLFHTPVTDSDGFWYTNTDLYGINISFRLADYEDSETWFGGLPYEQSYCFDTFLNPLKQDQYVSFGRYEQDGNLANGPEPIQWIPATGTRGEKVLISRYILDYGPYHSSSDSTAWAGCAMRQWLNGEFLNGAFTDEEREKIAVTRIYDDRYNVIVSDPLADPAFTDDCIFLLSVFEAERYFPSAEERIAEVTDYALSRSDQQNNWDYLAWYTRSAGGWGNYVATVSTEGEIDPVGYPVYGNAEAGIRPVLVLVP